MESRRQVYNRGEWGGNPGEREREIPASRSLEGTAQVREGRRFWEDGVNMMKLIEHLMDLNILRGYLPT